MKGILKTRNIKALCIAIMLMMILFIVAPIAVYAADNPLGFSVKQVFTANPASADGIFTYRLKPLAAGNPMPPGSAADGYSFTVDGTNGVQIGPMNYTRQGVYKYELFQVIGTEKSGYTYDKRVYTIEVHVDPALAAKIIIINQDGTKANGMEFRNSYGVLPSDPNLMADPPVKKTVFGNPAKNSIFTFKLTAQKLSNPMPPGSVNGIKTITIAGSGEGEFGKWSYDKEGVYYYTVSEVNSGENGYTYDTALYTITDSVKIENGRLVVYRIVTNDSNRQVTSLTFINKYNSGGGPGPDGPDPGGPKPGGPDPGGPKPDGPKPDGPKTGDGMNTGLYSVLLALGGVLTMCGIIYLVSGKRRKGGI